MKVISLLVMIFFSSSILAGHDGLFIIKGSVVEKDSCDIHIKQSGGQSVLFPLKEFKKYLLPDSKFKARLSIESLRLAFGHVVKRGSDLGGGSNTRGTDLGGGSNARGSDLGGGSNTRCKLRKKVLSLNQTTSNKSLKVLVLN